MTDTHRTTIKDVLKVLTDALACEGIVVETFYQGTRAPLGLNYILKEKTVASVDWHGLNLDFVELTLQQGSLVRAHATLFYHC